MDQASELQIEKLSGTLEELGLDRRAYHLIKRRGFHHVSNIITCGEMGILKIKGMGVFTANHIFSAVAKYLNIPREELFSSKTMQTVMSYEENPVDPLDAPVTILDLSIPTLRILNSLSVFTIGDLIRLKIEPGNGYDIGGFNKTEIRRIRTELSRYLSLNNDVDIEYQTNRELVKVRPIVKPSVFNLDAILASILKDERTLRIVELRANQLLTLEEIAIEVGGVTRERIRQILNQVQERIRKNLNLINVFCDYFEEISESLSKIFKGEIFTISALAEQYKSHLPSQRLNATEKELETLIVIIRLLVIQDKIWSEDILQKRWENTCFFASFANPPIKKHKLVNQILLKEEERKVSYKELALLILTNEKKPMHWSEIAEYAYRLGQRDSFNSSTLYNALMNYPDVFVRVDAGTYALVDWGFTQVSTYPDIIASIMKSHKKALSAETISYRVNGIRQIKPATLTMLLELHPRFYKSLEKTYGLRVWLPSRENQTLRTPEWLIEDSNSYKRIELASQRGYDIESMIQVDLDSD